MNSANCLTVEMHLNEHIVAAAALNDRCGFLCAPSGSGREAVAVAAGATDETDARRRSDGSAATMVETAASAGQLQRAFQPV